MNPEKVSLASPYEDKGEFIISGNYWKGTGNKGVILLHMMPAVKESWNNFSKILNTKDFYVLAIDLRGHGESKIWKNKNGDTHEFDYKIFTEKNHQDSFSDVEIAREFLISSGVPPENIFVCGASIGANLSLWYLAHFSDAQKAVLLSPGLDYKGIKTNELINNIVDNKKVFISAAKDDPYSYESSVELSKRSPKHVTFYEFSEGGHGTKLFETHPELMNKVVSFFES
jgi:pimeloyl-ACP methyl ester carboxylesterase